MSEFKRLSEPGMIGRMETRNRFVMAPMVTATGDADGFVTDDVVAYYEARAKGGVGLIVVQSCIIGLDTLGINKRWLCVYDDKFIPGLRRVAEAAKKHGAKIALQ